MLVPLKQIRELLRYPACFMAFGFGVGLLRIMPGTLATLLVGVPLYLLLATLGKFYYSLIVILLIGIGIFACSIAEEVLKSADDSMIVWDEICGYLFMMIATPKGSLWLLLGIVLFRYFDILKPWPIDAVDRAVKGGLGIMLDDLLAASYAQLVIRCLTYIL